MLEAKLKKAAQAILKNNSLFITSGTGMAADCSLKGKSFEGESIPSFRGTHGLWQNYPAMRNKLVSFDDFVTEDYFKDETKSFWYVWGDVFNRHKRATPHKGYKKLSQIIDLAGKRDKYFVYHSGVDKFYMQSNTTDGCDLSP